MGVARSYQAIPDSAEWLHRARDEWSSRAGGGPIASHLPYANGLLGSVIRSRTFMRDAPSHALIVQLVEADPTIVERYFDTNRTYDQLHFLLSVSRRESDLWMYSGFPEPLDLDAPDAIFDLAMLGDEILYGENVVDGRPPTGTSCVGTSSDSRSSTSSRPTLARACSSAPRDREA